MSPAPRRIQGHSPAPTIATEPGTNWLERAICTGMDPAVFTLEDGQSWTSDDGKAHAELARAVCVGRECPVLAECLADAIANRDDATFRGGLTPKQRKAWARRNKVTTGQKRAYLSGAAKRAKAEREREAS